MNASDVLDLYQELRGQFADRNEKYRLVAESLSR